MRTKQKIFFLLFSLSTLLSRGQINCSISVVPDSLEICKGDSVQLNSSGNVYELSWKPKVGLNDSTSPNPIAFPKITTKYNALNRYLYPVEIIVNGDFEQGDMGFSSQYGIDCTAGSIEQGYYCVNNQTDIYWPAWVACSDHTGASGNMMIIDAATTAGVSVWCQTVAVNPNTDYQFTTWISSVLDENPALLQFSINGQLLGEPFRASSVTCEWNQFYEIWNSGIATSAQICIVNQNTEGQGNDFALDDISFKSICFSEDSIVVVVHPDVSVNLGPDKTVCNGDNILLDTQLPANYQYSWSNGATASSTVVTSIGTYSVLINNGFGCTATDDIILSPVANPISTLETDTTLCFAFVPSYTLHAGSALSYSWSTGETSSEININEEGWYKILLSNGVHCSITDSLYIKDYCNPTFFYLPNSFTPNSDGLNDVFKIEGEFIYVLKLSVFNRWGQLIFETTDQKKGWDGNQLNGQAPMDVYVVLYEYEGLSPNTLNKEKVRRFTHVNLIR